MLKFISFGSGSSGNCYYLETESSGIIIDLGIAQRLFKKRVHEYGINLNKIEGILVTHDHTDHVKSVGTISSAYGLPVFAADKVHSRIVSNFMIRNKVPKELERRISCGESFFIGPFQISAVTVPHDSMLNYGYSIKANGTKICIFTDVGHFTEEIASLVSDADYLVIEANYDADMLKSGPYPDYLKKRISSGNGHSENKQTAAFLSENVSNNLKHVWLCHLSQENNRPEIAVETVSKFLNPMQTPGRTIKIDALPRKEAAGPFFLV